MKQVSKNTHKGRGVRTKFMKLFFILMTISIICFASYFSFIKIFEKSQLNISTDTVPKNIIENDELDNIQLVEERKKLQHKECLDANYVDQILLISTINASLENGNDISQIVNKLNSMYLSDSKLKELVARLNLYNLLKIENYYQLNKQFQDLYGRLIMSVTSDESTQNWFHKYFYKMISIRKIGPRAIKGGGVDGLLAQAKVALDNGDLQQTFDLFNSMPEAQKNIAGEWLLKLHNFVQIQNTVNVIYELVISPQYRSKFSMVCSND